MFVTLFNFFSLKVFLDFFGFKVLLNRNINSAVVMKVSILVIGEGESSVEDVASWRGSTVAGSSRKASSSLSVQSSMDLIMILEEEAKERQVLLKF